MDAQFSPLLAVGLGLIACSLLGGLLLVLRRRRRAAADHPPAVGPVDDDLRAAEPGPGPEPEADSSLVRALRLQVRVLEETLADATERAPDLAEALAAYRRQVHIAVRAVATTVGAEEQYAVARVAAAIERLDSPDGFARPVLPDAPQRRVELVPAVPGPPVGEQALGERPDPVAAAPEPPAPGPRADPQVRILAAPEPEVVLPVPPPAPAETRRRRWRQRRTAA